MRKSAPLITFSGYTLIEILVGITIIALLFSLGYANYRDYARRQALIGAARKIKADLRLAQEFALAGKKPSDCSGNVLDGYRFKIDTSADTYDIVAVCGGVEENVDRNDIEVGEGIDISSTTNPSSILFKVLGQGTDLDASGAIIIFIQEGTGEELSVTVNANGEIE